MAEDVIIVGGGLAGIASSLALADEMTDSGQKRFNVTLVEASGKLGGRVTSITDPKTGYTLDNCQHSCFRVYHRFLQLVSRANAVDSIKLQEKTRIMFIEPKTGRRSTITDGKLSPPNHLLGSILKFPFLSLRDKVPMRKVVKSMRKMSTEERMELDNISFEQWLKNNGQTDDSIRIFWEFFVKAALNTTIAEASANQAIMLFKYGLFNDVDSFDVGAFRNDLSSSIHPYFESALREAGVEIKFNTICKSIIWNDNSCKGIHTSKEELKYDKVIVALPQHNAKKVLSASSGTFRGKTDDVTEKLDGVEYRSLIGLHGIFEDNFLKEEFSFAAMIDEPVIQLIFNKNDELDDEYKLPDKKLWLSVPVSAADEFLEWDDAQFRNEFERVIELIWPGSSRKLERFVVIKVPNATFAPLVNSKKLRPQIDEIGGGLFLAGDYTDCDWPSTMEGAVRSGLLAAAAVSGNKNWNADEEWVNWPQRPKRNNEAWEKW